MNIRYDDHGTVYVFIGAVHVTRRMRVQPERLYVTNHSKNKVQCSAVPHINTSHDRLSTLYL